VRQRCNTLTRLGGAQNAGRMINMSFLKKPDTRQTKVVLSVMACLDCNRLVPAGVLDCPHCHSPNRKLAIPKDVLKLMMEARSKTDDGARCLLASDLQNAIRLTREALGMNPWQATAHGNLGGMLLKHNELDEAAESLERAFLLCPSLEGVKEYLDIVALRLGKPVRSWRQYRFMAIFEFDTEKHAVDSLGVLPDELLRRMENPKLTHAPNGIFLELSANPLTKAEIWYTVLALDACGFSKMSLGLPGMTREERDRVLKRFLPGRM
jgi:hypothetical protein